VVAALAGTALVARLRWRRASDAVAARIAEGAVAPGAPFRTAQLDGLPAPVARYLRSVLPEGRPLPRAARLRQEGTFLMRAAPETWVPFTATQRMRARPAAFVWDATMRMAPLTDVFVRDAFVAGEGSMRASVLGLKSMVNQSGTPALARGSLMRFLAEAVWLPSALLPSPELAWSPVDERRAVATLTSGGVSVAVEFRFGEDGLVEGIAAERERDVDGTAVPMRWEGRWTAYAERGGLRVPVEGEVAWITPDGRRETYWRGRVTEMAYEP
jgi:hypothetical protein